MKSFRLIPVVCLVASGALALTQNRAAAQDGRGAVFVMTNAASNNQINAYTRQDDGSLTWAGAFATGGNGSGGTIDPLHSQGSLKLSDDHRLLFAVNAGSGTVSSFAVEGASLRLLGTEPTGGSTPSSVTQSGDLLYVLNSGGNGSVSGFRIVGNGRLLPINDSTRSLSGTATSPTDIVLSPNRQFLVVAESGTNTIDVFRVYPDGRLSAPVTNASAGTVPFAAVFASSGALIVGNASNSISSYSVDWTQHLHTISDAVPTLGMATCWDTLAWDGRIVYTSNAGSSTLSGFTIGRNGALTAIGGTVVASNPSGSTNLDVAASSNGKFIYTLNSAAGAIGKFEVQSDGSLVSLGQVDGLPASAGMNGIAAY